MSTNWKNTKEFLEFLETPVEREIIIKRKKPVRKNKFKSYIDKVKIEWETFLISTFVKASFYYRYRTTNRTLKKLIRLFTKIIRYFNIHCANHINRIDLINLYWSKEIKLACYRIILQTIPGYDDINYSEDLDDVLYEIDLTSDHVYPVDTDNINTHVDRIKFDPVYNARRYESIVEYIDNGGDLNCFGITERSKKKDGNEPTV